MLVRADALATPATAFEPDRQVVLEAIRQSQPGSSALNLEQAIQYRPTRHAPAIGAPRGNRVRRAQAAFRSSRPS